MGFACFAAPFAEEVPVRLLRALGGPLFRRQGRDRREWGTCFALHLDVWNSHVAKEESHGTPVERVERLRRVRGDLL